MATKTSGAEFKAFYNDPLFWVDHGTDEHTYHDDTVIVVNGVHDENLDPDDIPDDAVVTIEGGVIFGPTYGASEPSMEAYFKRWKKRQTTSTLLVEAPNEKIEAIKAAIKAAGGTVK